LLVDIAIGQLEPNTARGHITGPDADVRPVAVGRWILLSLCLALGMLLAVLAVAELSSGYVSEPPEAPPFVAGNLRDVLNILQHNALVLALNALACVALFRADDMRSPTATSTQRRLARLIVGAVPVVIVSSLGRQTYELGRLLAGAGGYLDSPTKPLLLSILPHAVLELTGMFLPLAAGIALIRRHRWASLLRAAGLSVLLATPMVLAAAFVEVYVSPSVYQSLVCTYVGERLASQKGCGPQPCPKLTPQQFEARYKIRVSRRRYKDELATCTPRSPTAQVGGL
jgi:hypothetical protein